MYVQREHDRLVRTTIEYLPYHEVIRRQNVRTGRFQQAGGVTGGNQRKVSDELQRRPRVREICKEFRIDEVSACLHALWALQPECWRTLWKRNRHPVTGLTNTQIILWWVSKARTATERVAVSAWGNLVRGIGFEPMTFGFGG
ncbi:MAG: hypothetical protein HQM03_06310 [Magnetococcales bacterium]|nr:hypothetical protein [Magnetococcales bacterium]